MTIDPSKMDQANDALQQKVNNANVQRYAAETTAVVDQLVAAHNQAPDQPPDVPPDAGGVTPPAPPATYTLPLGVASVTSSAELVAALAGPPGDLVLEDGTYDVGAVHVNDHSLYARNLGKAKIVGSLVFGNDGGGGHTLQGLAFVAGSGQTANQVDAWGPNAQGLTILDCTFDGGRSARCGIYIPRGLREAGRLVGHSQIGWGLFFDPNDTSYVPDEPAHVHDVSWSSVYNPPGDDYGRSEACVWVGHNALVERVVCDQAGGFGWMGLWTGGACKKGTVLTDIRCVGCQNVQWYAEHYSPEIVVDRIEVDGTGFRTSNRQGVPVTGAAYGMNFEWDYGEPGNGAVDRGTITGARIANVLVGLGLEAHGLTNSRLEARLENVPETTRGFDPADGNTLVLT